MNKEKKYYLISWVLLVALFNLICFVTPEYLYGFNKYGGGFWPGYGAIMLTFVIHMVFVLKALDEEGRRKKVLNAPLIVISFIELLIMVIAGGACMAIPGIAYWVGIIICAAILVFSIVFMLTAKVAGENAYDANVTLNENVSLFRDIIAEAELLQSRSITEEAKICAKKVYEAVRYSDLMSDASLMAEETAIQNAVRELAALVGCEDRISEMQEKTDGLLQLIETRNLKCRNNKRNRM